jgi:hypothetical protein
MTTIVGAGGSSGGKGGGGSQHVPTTTPESLFSTSYANLIDLISEGEIYGLSNGLSSIFINNTPLLNPDAVIKSGTYTQDGITITVTIPGHGYAVDNIIALVDSGTNFAVTGNYTITSVTADTFTAASKTSSSLSGSLTATYASYYNFTPANIYTRNGTQAQSYIPGFTDVENEIGVDVTVQHATPVVRTVTNKQVNAARVTITVPQLQQISDNGDINGADVQLQIAVQYNGGGYTTVIDDTISGRTGSNYQRQYLVNFTGSFPIDIKVIRVSADPTDPKLTNGITWSSYTEVVNSALRYPNSALVGISIDAQQFSSIPTRSYRIKGIKVKIPSNATVDATNGRLIYTGVWDGTFGAAQWCSDPAWCLFDLLCSTRYGFGDHIDTTQLDRWAFYSASQYCSELVDNGFGGTEPRFSCNVNIQTEEDAYKLINDMASVFRAMPYWSTGSLTVSQDRPSDPAYLFTLANVSSEGFSYSGSSLKTRPNVVVVQYMDLDQRTTAFEEVENAASIAKFGVIKTQITAFACTSRGQAHRVGDWLLYTANYEATETVTFTASIDAGVLVRPGQIIEISDPVRAGSRRGGRINSATTTVITVDDATGLTTSNSPMLSVILSDGTVQTRAVASIVGNAITVSSAFSSVPNTNSVWIYETSDLQTTTWRVLGVQEQDQCSYAITALAYNSSKYDYIERGVALQTRAVSNLNNVPAAPTNIIITEALYSYQAQVRSKIIISWKGVQGINQYLVKYRKDKGNWTTITRQQQDYEILDTTPGLFEIYIYSVNAGGQSSSTALIGTINALGKTAPPANVPALYAMLDPDVGVTLNWEEVTDLDLQGYAIWQGPAWGSGTKLGVFAATSKKLGLLSAGTTTWWIKALDTSGSYSTTATSASLTITAAAAPTTSGLFSNDSLILKWTSVAGSLSTAYYEVRYGTVSDTWATATTLGTVLGTTLTIKGAWVGTRRFFIAAVDLKGNYGTSGTYDAVITAPSQPTITQQVIDNNVLLQWTDATQTLPITAYELRKGTTWAGATVIGTKQGKFTTVFESSSGTYTYWLAGIDSAGNYGTPGSVSAQVNQPPDYVLKLNQDSTFTGTSTNMVSYGTGLLASVNTTETWQSHFTSRSWNTPQDQINAGYPYFAMPSQATAQYYEDIDYGTVLAGTKVTTTLTSNVVAGSTTITPSISVKKLSTDAWTVYSNVSSVFATNFRYVRTQYDFASAGGDDLLQITGLNVRLDSKLRNDSGTGTANSADSGGTAVNFNIAFVDVDSISVTPATTSAVIAVYDFTDVPYPTSFKVLLFNTSGTRVSGGFSWIARGV